MAGNPEVGGPAGAARLRHGPPSASGAFARVTMLASTAESVVANQMKKGDVLGTARFAGLQASKDAAALVPLASPAPAHEVTISFEVLDDCIDVLALVDVASMPEAATQALVAASVAALTIYDMCKSVDRTMSIHELCVLSGDGAAPT